MEKVDRRISNVGDLKAFKYYGARLSERVYRFSYNFCKLRPFDIECPLTSVQTCFKCVRFISILSYIVQVLVLDIFGHTIFQYLNHHYRVFIIVLRDSNITKIVFLGEDEL